MPANINANQSKLHEKHAHTNIEKANRAKKNNITKIKKIIFNNNKKLKFLNQK